MTLPNFLLIGAQKAGTTSVYQYLRQHPDVFMSPMKEPMYFMVQGMEKTYPNTVADRDEYEALFDGATNEAARGEASTNYLSCPWAPRLIREQLPGVRLVAILRHPVDRAFSHYLMHVRKGAKMFSSDLSSALNETHIYERKGAVWEFSYLTQGLYHAHLSRYYDAFDVRRIKVFLYSDLVADAGAVMKAMFVFLGVDDAIVPDTTQRHNVAGVARVKVVDDLLHKPSRLKAALRPFVPRRVRNALKRKGDRMNRPKLSSRMRRELTAFYREDILKLQDLIDRDLSSWLSA
jgi:hypothetical protein